MCVTDGCMLFTMMNKNLCNTVKENGLQVNSFRQKIILDHLTENYKKN